MDGTLAFINKRPGFSVSIALVAKDGTPHIGVVYDPSTDILYHAIKGKGAFKNGRPWEIKHTNNHLTYVTDRKLKDTPRAAEIEKLLNKNATQLSLNGVKEIAGAGAVATNFGGGRIDLNKKEGTFMNEEGIFYGNLINAEDS